MQNEISNRIKTQRKVLGVTQQELADKIGVSMMTVVRWEKGVRTPNSSIMPRLAEALNTSIEYLMGLNSSNQHKELHILSDTLADENFDPNTPVLGDIERDTLIIRDGNSNRTYYMPNNEEGRKLFLSILANGLQGYNSPLVSNSINGDHNSGNNLAIVNK